MGHRKKRNVLRSPIFLALDMTDVPRAKQLVARCDGLIAGVKIGLEFWCANGGPGVSEVVGDRALFLDLKFKDIPRTVAGAVRAVLPMEPDFLTLHIDGGEPMLQAAVAAADTAAKHNWTRPKLLGVTILTSAEAESGAVVEMARIAKANGLDGVVCSTHEAALVRTEFKAPFIIMVAGVRPEWWPPSDDQVRVGTPRAAMTAGADFIVIGRPITESSDPARAARDLWNSITDET